MSQRFAANKVLVFITMSLVVTGIIFFAQTLEDAQITYRYALRFSEGYAFGMWNREGVPVEGFTSFLWMPFLSLFGPSVNEIATASKITGILSLYGLSYLFFALSREVHNKTAVFNPFAGNESLVSMALLYTSIAIALYLPLARYASTGMETVPYIFLIFLALLGPLLIENLLVLLLLYVCVVLIRPEGIAFALSGAIYYFSISRDKKFLFLLGVSLATVVAIYVFRYEYFGELMPNTYYAKSGGNIAGTHFIHGIKYFATFILSHIYLFIPVGMYIWRKRTQTDAFIVFSLLGALIYFAILAKAGADEFSAFPFWRHGITLFPLLVFVAMYCAVAMCMRKYIVVMLVFVLLGPLTITIPNSQSNKMTKSLIDGILNPNKFTNDVMNNPMLLWLKSVTDKNTLIATSLAGEFPLTVDADHIDTLGLNDRYIAQHGTFELDGRVDSKTDMVYVLGRQPDIIDVNLPYSFLKKGDYQRAFSNRRKMKTELFKQKEFLENYMIIVNAPYASMDRTLFVRKSYYDTHTGIEVVAITTLIPKEFLKRL